MVKAWWQSIPHESAWQCICTVGMQLHAFHLLIRTKAQSQNLYKVTHVPHVYARVRVCFVRLWMWVTHVSIGTGSWAGWKTSLTLHFPPSALMLTLWYCDQPFTSTAPSTYSPPFSFTLFYLSTSVSLPSSTPPLSQHLHLPLSSYRPSSLSPSPRSCDAEHICGSHVWIRRAWAGHDRVRGERAIPHSQLLNLNLGW